MRTDREMLVSLRVSLARVAQAAGVAGSLEGMDIVDLATEASTRDHGWNILCADIIERIRDLKSEVRRLDGGVS